MARAMVNNEKRIVNWMDDDSFNKVPSDDKQVIAARFPVEFDNQELIMSTPHYSIEDFIIENGVAIFDPLPESRNAMIRNEVMNSVPEYLENTDNAICYLYEETLAQQETIDDQDAAICALYEMIGA